MKSDLTETTSPTGKAVVGMYIGELIPEKYVLHYYEAIMEAIESGVALCSYEIGDRMFVARLNRVSDRRVKVARLDVTGLPLHEILGLF